MTVISREHRQQCFISVLFHVVRASLNRFEILSMFLTCSLIGRRYHEWAIVGVFSYDTTRVTGCKSEVVTT